MLKTLNKGISTPLAITIIVVLTVILVGGILGYQYWWTLEKPVPTPTPEPTPISVPTPIFEPEIIFSDDCEELFEQIKDLIKQANYCNTDDDCIIGDFLCGKLVNENADLTKIEEGLRKYEENCNPPALLCAPLPEKEDIKCSNNKCVDTRFTAMPTSDAD